MKKAKFFIISILVVITVFSSNTLYAIQQPDSDGYMIATGQTNNYITSGSIPTGAAGGPFDPGQLQTGGSVGTLKPTIDGIYSTIILILQTASVAGVLFAGVRYMFASADSRSDIKNQMIYLVIGMVIVFASSTIIKFVLDASVGLGIT